MKAGLIERWRDVLPVGPDTPVVTLHEGGTPLLPAPKLAEAAGLRAGSVFLKIEGTNPTGSFKDRGMTVAVSKAVEAGAKGVICASTGNTSASAAAYAARAGLPCYVLLPEGKVAAGKVAQVLAYGAKLVRVKGNFDAALERMLEIAERAGLCVVNSTNPHRLEGQKTASYEVAEQLGRLPDWHFIPVGNAGNITAYWRGYLEVARRDGGTPPRMMGWQAAGAAPLVRGKPVADPETVATAIRIGNPVSWKGAVEARDASGGAIGAVSDDEILAAYRFLAEREGVFAEPSSAASAAGLLSFAKDGGFMKHAPPPDGWRVVCVLTGHGLKDPDRPAALRPGALGEPVADDTVAIAEALGL